jgi:hypothetical protein
LDSPTSLSSDLCDSRRCSRCCVCQYLRNASAAVDSPTGTRGGRPPIKRPCDRVARKQGAQARLLFGQRRTALRPGTGREDPDGSLEPNVYSPSRPPESQIESRIRSDKALPRHESMFTL